MAGFAWRRLRQEPVGLLLAHRLGTRTPARLGDDARLSPLAVGPLTLAASDVELDSTEPSYTSVLLDRLAAQGVAASQMVFITGADAFAEIASWRNYPALLDHSHFAVVSRPGRSAASFTSSPTTRRPVSPG